MLTHGPFTLYQGLFVKLYWFSGNMTNRVAQLRLNLRFWRWCLFGLLGHLPTFCCVLLTVVQSGQVENFQGSDNTKRYGVASYCTHEYNVLFADVHLLDQEDFAGKDTPV